MKDGGPAYPRPAGWGKDAWYDGAKSLTLRDYLAAKAMQGILITDGREVAHLRDTFEGVARRAFKMADAMLKAREQ